MIVPEGYKEIEINDPDFDSLFKAGRIDELCRCGRLKSEHQDSARGLALGVSIPGHGQCAESQCPQFTWTAFVKKVN